MNAPDIYVALGENYFCRARNHKHKLAKRIWSCDWLRAPQPINMASACPAVLLTSSTPFQADRRRKRLCGAALLLLISVFSVHHVPVQCFLEPSYRSSLRICTSRKKYHAIDEDNNNMVNEATVASRRHFLNSPRRAAVTTTTTLSMASSKTGARLIKSNEEYAECVMNSELAKPVLVFFTAPWYVAF